MNLLKNVKISRSHNAVVAGTSNQDGTNIIDMAGFEGCLFVAALGTATTGHLTSIVVQGSPNSDMSSAVTYTTSQTTNAIDAASNKLIVTDIFRPAHRYIRARINRGTANCVIDGCIAIQYGAKVSPPTQATHVDQAVQTVSPDYA
jgi:hypothetical protein